MIKASLLGQGRQAPSSRPSQRDRGRTDGGLRAHSGGLAAKAAGYTGLGSVGVDIYKLFAFVGGTSFFKRCAVPRAFSPAMHALSKPIDHRFACTSLGTRAIWTLDSEPFPNPFQMT